MTIPASRIVQIIPSVEGATGAQLALNGLMATENWRVPINTVANFSDAAEMNGYFGATAIEAVWGGIYFNGFTGRTQLPSALLVAQFPASSVGAWLLGGPFDTLTIPQVQGINGTLSIVVDGYTYTAPSLNLSAATSYTAAAGLIQSALNNTLASAAVSASAGGSIAAQTGVTATGYISGNVLNITSTPTAFLPVGASVTGVGVTANTVVTAQLTGVAGGIGTYAVNNTQSAVTGTMTFSYGVMTLTGANASGTFSIGQTLSGSGVTTGTMITALGTGTGGPGTYYVSPSQTVSSQTITATGTPLSVTFDVTSGGLKIASGSVGSLVSTIAFATGTTATQLFLTAQSGAVISQGATAQTPGEFMNAMVLLNQDWANVFTVFDPDGGPQNGPGQKLLWSAWVNGQNDRYAYIGWDADLTPTTSDAATTSFGYQVVEVFDYSGTFPVWDNSMAGYAAFVAGSAASLNFGQTNGRATFAFRSQTGLVADVTTDLVYTNLISNNYNIYGAFATAAQQFIFMYPGLISGPFLWMDSYQNQIFMNAAFQVDYMELLTQVFSIPYNGAGAAQMEQAVLSTIQQMVNFGAIRTGVTLSSLEIEEVNSQAGYPIDQTLFAQGWYYQVQAATPAVRQARGSPPVFFWYVDGQSVQMITQNSILLL